MPDLQGKVQNAGYTKEIMKSIVKISGLFVPMGTIKITFHDTFQASTALPVKFLVLMLENLCLFFLSCIDKLLNNFPSMPLMNTRFLFLF